MTIARKLSQCVRDFLRYRICLTRLSDKLRRRQGRTQIPSFRAELIGAMKNRSSVVFPLLKVLVLLVFTGSLAFGQSSPHLQRNKARPAHPHSSAKTKSSELVRLAEKLRAHGATVSVTREKVSQPFFSVAGRVININGEPVQAFEYATPSVANTDASRVSADGMTIGTSKPSWMASSFLQERKVDRALCWRESGGYGSSSNNPR